MQRGYFVVILVSAGLTGCAGAVANGAGGQGAPVGLSVGVHAAPTIMSDDFDDYTGGGIGLSVGYGFTPRTSVFVGVDVAGMTSDTRFDGFGEEQTSDLTHWDVGVRYSFDAPGRRFVPYLSAALTQRTNSGEFCDGFTCYDIESSGSGFSGGVGLQLFFIESLALDAGWLLSFGSFSEASVDGESVTLEDEPSVDTGRFMIGASWYPSRSGESGAGGGGGGPIK